MPNRSGFQPQVAVDYVAYSAVVRNLKPNSRIATHPSDHVVILAADPIYGHESRE